MFTNFDFSKVYGHTASNNRIEFLEKHLKSTYNNYLEHFDTNIVKKLIEAICSKNEIEEVKGLVIEMGESIFLWHDVGKINPLMQNKKLSNSVEYNDRLTDDTHSLLSSLLYLNYWHNKINLLKEETKKDKKKKKYLNDLALKFSYIISRHHSKLQNYDGVYYVKDELENIEEQIKNKSDYIMFFKGEIKINFKCFNKKLKYKNEYDIYILMKLLYSLLITCDVYATYTFDTELCVQRRIITENKLENYLNSYHDGDIYKGIQNYIKSDYTSFDENNINKLRSDMFIEADQNLMANLNKYIYYLEAPTGGGKTNISINLALQLLKKTNANKLTYVFPFNTLVEQTQEVLKEYFREDVVVKNSITAIKTEKEDEEANYKKDLLDYDFIHYPITITSHVQLFNILFGNNKKSNLALCQLMNSVVIIDEVQSYCNKKWIQIVNFLSKYAETLNIKLIIMSATLPSLYNLDYNNVPYAKLINDRNKYFKDKLFRERVTCDFELLDKGKIDENELMDKLQETINNNIIKHRDKILIEFINTTSAYDFYEKTKDQFKGYVVYRLTSHDSKMYRKYVVDKLKQENIKVILISTQVIEAGVDIDMDIGFKDISLLDAEEQFLGRINRSCKKPGCRAYFFDMNDVDNIYKEDFRKEKDLKKEEYRQYLNNKDFDEFYGLNFKRLIEKSKSNSKINYDDFLNRVLNLQYKQINEDMQLIEEESVQLFVPRKIYDENNKEIEGVEIWSNFKELTYDKEKDYADKQIELSKLKEKMQYFTYNFAIYKEKQNKILPNYFDEELNGYYLLNESASEEYLLADDQGKINTYKSGFDMKKYREDCNGIF